MMMMEGNERTEIPLLQWNECSILQVLSERKKIQASQKCPVCDEFITGTSRYIVGNGLMVHDDCSSYMGQVVCFTAPPIETCPQRLLDMLIYEHAKYSVLYNIRTEQDTTGEEKIEYGEKENYLEFHDFVQRLYIFNDLGLCRNCGRPSRVNVVEACDDCWNFVPDGDE